MNVLLTGGCGFIGSHQAIVLIEAGHKVVVVDDLSNSRADVIDRIAEICGVRPAFEHLDVRHTDSLATIMVQHECDVVIHFAGMKHVAESMERAVTYLDVNLAGLTSVLQAADSSGIRRLIFSSSGSVYGPSSQIPIPEDSPLAPTNPYSKSKAICEQVLAAVCEVDQSWSVIALRYFNPAGAHPSGLIGEDPTHLISNIVPVIMETAVGARESLPIYGTDFDTEDGTAIRDYVHVMDVAAAHSAAMDLLEHSPGFTALNIGRGEGVSVRQILEAARRALGKAIPAVEHPRRAGDVASLVADTTKSDRILNLNEYQDMEAIFSDAWRFRSSRSS